MYVCGPTVYDFAHIGNARPVIVFDVLFRLLRRLYGADHVTLCPQHHRRRRQDQRAGGRASPAATKRSASSRTAARAIPRRCRRARLPQADERAARHRPYRGHEGADRAADRARRRLCRGGPCAVLASPSMPHYGSAGARSLDEMLAGARVDVAPYKRDPMDFVLWKPSKARPAGWPSPAGSRHRGAPAGTSSARRCRGSISARPSTSTAAASTSSSPITRTRSRRPAARSARRHGRSGCTTDSCRSRARRCRRASATSSRSASC